LATKPGLFSIAAPAWLAAGTLDVTAAVTYYPLTAGVSPLRILQGIASGLLGASAFSGGLASAALGLALHYLIALIWTILYCLAARRFAALVRHRVVAGLAYGVVVWAGMNLVVLPLSRVRHAPFNLRQALVAAAILMVCLGLPIATIIGRRLQTKTPAAPSGARDRRTATRAG